MKAFDIGGLIRPYVLHRKPDTGETLILAREYFPVGSRERSRETEESSRVYTFIDERLGARLSAMNEPSNGIVYLGGPEKSPTLSEHERQALLLRVPVFATHGEYRRALREGVSAEADSSYLGHVEGLCEIAWLTSHRDREYHDRPVVGALDELANLDDVPGRPWSSKRWPSLREEFGIDGAALEQMLRLPANVAALEACGVTIEWLEDERVALHFFDTWKAEAERLDELHPLRRRVPEPAF